MKALITFLTTSQDPKHPHRTLIETLIEAPLDPFSEPVKEPYLLSPMILQVP